MARGNDPDVDRNRLGFAHGVNQAPLQNAEEQGLHLTRKILQLVQEQRTAVRSAKVAKGRRLRAGEGTLFMTEELGLGEVFGNCRAVHGVK